MTRYFFNIRSGGDYVVDDHGEECPSLHAAEARALGGARELLQALHDSRRGPQVTAFEIMDERGGLCLRIPLTLAWRSPPKAGVGEVR